MTAADSQPRIVTPRGKTLTWDADDRLWLLRAVEAEGPPRDLVAQVLVNRWAWMWDEVPGKYTKLAELVRAYAQPCNPAWYPEGRLFLARLEDLHESERAAAVLRARKRRDVISTRKQFSAAAQIAVDTALLGPVTLPAGALHYAAVSLARPDLPVLVPGDDRTNVIYGEAHSRGVRARYSLSPQSAPAPAPGTSRISPRIGDVAGVLTLGFGVGLAVPEAK